MDGHLGVGGEALVQVAGAALDVDAGLRGELGDTFALRNHTRVRLFGFTAVFTRGICIPRGWTWSVTGLEAMIGFLARVACEGEGGFDSLGLLELRLYQPMVSRELAVRQ